MGSEMCIRDSFGPNAGCRRGRNRSHRTRESIEHLWRCLESRRGPTERPFLQAHPKKAEEVLGWRAEHHWEGVLDVMFEHDLKELTQQMR